MHKITRRKAILLTATLTTVPKLRDVFKIKGDGSMVKCRMCDLEPGDLFEINMSDIGEKPHRGIVKDRPFKNKNVWGVVSNERS